MIRAQLSFARGPENESLKRDIATMERLVNQLLDHARLGGLHVEPHDVVDLSVVATDVAEFIAPLALSKSRDIEVLHSDGPVLVRGAYDFIFRALRNLVENAIVHTPSGSLISVVVNSSGSIDVIDDGPGVPLEEREKILKRFWQGRRDRSEGAGLGLSIVHQTMLLHDGTLHVFAAEGRGACFSMIFPAFVERPVNSANVFEAFVPKRQHIETAIP